MNSRIRGEEQVFCLLRSGEHYDNVQCRVGIHCTLSNRLRSLPGLLSRSCGVRNKQAQVENSSSLSVLSVTPPPHPPILFVFVHPPSVVYRSTIQRSCRFCSWLEKKKKIRHLFATETLLAPISLCVDIRCTYPWHMLDLRLKVVNKNSLILLIISILLE